jgi:multidrug efflux pump subunit AcrA (membrane-fusion protein)
MLPALFLVIGLLAAGPVGVGPSPAAAQSCYSPAQARAAVQAGKIPNIPSLANFLGQIRARGYDVLGGQLCDVGGRLVYKVQVLIGGRQKTLNVDAFTGAIN